MRKLSDLEVGESGILITLDLPPGVQNHLMYMGFVPDAQVKALHRAPAGDPTVYSVDGIEIALRRETAKSIQVRVRPLEINPQAVPETIPAPLRQAELEAVKELVEAGQ